ncbi:thioredoxin family protein [Candidatus Daviesbacteria bacterium]|nr:thioredoxin family protein [Candidatus Daviesbacteria bacterium]MBI2596724.1 thioredoxin family protein [Candidatus Daviesbacteria bacterium]
MKFFNVFIIASIAIIAIGFIFLKGVFNTSSNIAKTEDSNAPVLMDLMNYIDYSEQNQLNAQKIGRPVLFFAATLWCQTCTQLDKEIKERAGSLPSDVTILKVDYDNDREMKRTWGVTTQHTLIQLNSNGSEVNRWIGGNFDALLQNLR